MRISVRARPPGRRLSALGATVSCLAVTWLGCAGGTPQIGVDTALAMGEEQVPYVQFERYLERNVGGGDAIGSMPSDGVLSQLFDRFVDEQLLVRLAVGAGYDEAAVEADDQRPAIAFLLEQALGRELPSEASIRAYYAAHAERFAQGAQVHLWQILVARRELAESARRAIMAGESFESVAARIATDPDANFCGDQGLLAHEDLPDPFADVIFGLAPGETSEILEADLGFYLFKVEESLPESVVPVEEAADEIRETLRRDRLAELEQALIEEARARYNVRVFAANLPFDYQGSYDELG